MALPVFIGDEVTAAGFRLAGLDTRAPAREEAGRALARAREEGPPLILLTAEYAEQVTDSALHAALVAGRPLLLLVPDAAGRVPVPDLLARIRARVGLE